MLDRRCEYDKINDLSCLFGGAAASSGCCQSDGGLEGVVNPPLETGEGTDHDDPGHQSSPESRKSNFSIDPSDFGCQRSLLTSFGVQFRNHCVSRVRNNGAEDTSKVTRGEGNAQLGSLIVVFFAFGENVVVEELHEPLESNEFDDGVGNLPGPERS